MTGFVVAAAIAVLLALALLLRPFLRVGAAAPLSRRQLNAAIYRDQLARLDQDLAEGSIGAADHAQARTELQRSVLQDTEQQDAAPQLHPPKWTLAAIVLMLPLAAVGIYFMIGNPAGLNPAAVSAASPPPDIERMVARLAAKLEKEPGNLQGWAMLARSYKVMGRPLEAEQAYDRAGTFVDTDAQLLADYADVAAVNAGGNFAGKPARLVEKALKVDPQNTMALWLAGTAALSAGQNDKAAAIWDGLMKLLPVGSEDARMLQAAIDEARGRGKSAGAGTGAGRGRDGRCCRPVRGPQRQRHRRTGVRAALEDGGRRHGDGDRTPARLAHAGGRAARARCAAAAEVHARRFARDESGVADLQRARGRNRGADFALGTGDAGGRGSDLVGPDDPRRHARRHVERGPGPALSGLRGGPGSAGRVCASPA
jgi:cytochrome c-type biogenesis protein CcmH